MNCAQCNKTCVNSYNNSHGTGTTPAPGNLNLELAQQQIKDLRK